MEPRGFSEEWKDDVYVWECVGWKGKWDTLPYVVFNLISVLKIYF